MSDDRTWWPAGYGNDPAFQVRRIPYGTATGGDYVRGSGVVTLAQTALRYPIEVVNVSTIEGKAVLFTHPIDYETVEIQWGWPPGLADTWLEVALVRSAFGRPSTVNDGQTVFWAEHAAFEADDGLAPGPLVHDKPLPGGHWYHYGLFFKVSEVEWVRAMVDATLLPRNLGHQDHLWDSVPPYYRWTDDNYRVGDGYLRQFLNVFGYELDTTREYIESWQHLYDADWSPIRLLRNLGPNFGYPYESGVGDIRYRSLFCDLGELYGVRGTVACLERLIEGLSKYDCQVTSGIGLSLLPDDSDFYNGTGNWAGVHPDTPNSVDAGMLSPDKVKLMKSPVGEAVPPAGRGSMRVWTAKADATTNLMITLGDGVYYDPVTPDNLHRRYILPGQTGVPVRVGVSYGFTVYVQVATPPVTVEPGLLWFDQDGQPTDFVSQTKGNPVGLSDTAWHLYTVEGQCPANGEFMVPYLTFTSRVSGTDVNVSPYIHIAAALLYVAKEAGQALIVPPNRYLTVGDPSEKLGPDLNFKGNLTGAATAMPSNPTLYDAYTLTPAPVPTAAPQFKGVTPNRAAAVNDVVYWNGTLWVNAGPVPTTFDPFLMGAPST